MTFLSSTRGGNGPSSDRGFSDESLLVTVQFNCIPSRISPQIPFQLYLIFSSGYALHQPLRSAPYDMYVTNLRLRLPHHKAGYIHIDKCRYDTLHKLLQTNLLFRDLSITGNIQLVSDTLGKKLLDESQTSTERYPDLGID